MSGHDRNNCLCDGCTAWRFDRSRSSQGGAQTGRRGGGRRSGPPIAKNPANQAHVDQLWKEEQERKAKERRQNKVRGAVQNIAVLGQLGLAVTGADSSLASSALDQPLNATGSMSDMVETAQNAEEQRRGRDVRGGTRDKGRRDRGSGQR